MYDDSLRDFVYVPRVGVDEELVQELLSGQYCHVLSPPRTGKTKLLEAVERDLWKRGVSCTTISLKYLMTEVSTSQRSEHDWYGAITSMIATFFEIHETQEYEDFVDIDKREIRHPKVWLTIFIRDVLLRKIGERVVIIFDDVDYLLKFTFPNFEDRQLQDFRNQFFRVLRQCYELRNNQDSQQFNQYHRLTFALAGSARELDLVQASNCTLFPNISRSFELKDFKYEELFNQTRVAQWLGEVPPVSQADVLEVLKQTEGHPALTAYLLKHVQAQPSLRNFIEDILIPNWESNELSFLENIREALNQPSLLSLYRRILSGDRIVYSPKNPDQERLRMLGLVAVRDFYIEVHNPIFRQVSLDYWNSDLNDAEASTDPINQSLPNSTLSEETDSIRQDAIPNPDTEDINSYSQPVPRQENNEENTPPRRTTRIPRWLTSRFGKALALAFLPTLTGILTQFNPILLLPCIILFTFLLALFYLEEKHPDAIEDFIEGFLQRMSGRHIVSFPTRISIDLTHTFRNLISLFLIGIVIVFILSASKDFLPVWGAKKLGDDAVAVMESFWTNKSSQIEVLEDAIELGMKAEWSHNLPWNQHQPMPISPMLALQSIQHNIIQSDVYELNGFKSFQNATATADGKVIAAVGSTNQGSLDDSGDWIVIWNGSEKPVTFSSSQG